MKNNIKEHNNNYIETLEDEFKKLLTKIFQDLFKKCISEELSKTYNIPISINDIAEADIDHHQINNSVNISLEVMHKMSDDLIHKYEISMSEANEVAKEITIIMAKDNLSLDQVEQRAKKILKEKEESKRKLYNFDIIHNKIDNIILNQESYIKTNQPSFYSLILKRSKTDLIALIKGGNYEHFIPALISTTQLKDIFDEMNINPETKRIDKEFLKNKIYFYKDEKSREEEDEAIREVEKEICLPKTIESLALNGIYFFDTNSKLANYCKNFYQLTIFQILLANKEKEEMNFHYSIDEIQGRKELKQLLSLTHKEIIKYLLKSPDVGKVAIIKAPIIYFLRKIIVSDIIINYHLTLIEVLHNDLFDLIKETKIYKELTKINIGIILPSIINLSKEDKLDLDYYFSLLSHEIGSRASICQTVFSLDLINLMQFIVNDHSNNKANHNILKDLLNQSYEEFDKFFKNINYESDKELNKLTEGQSDDYIKLGDNFEIIFNKDKKYSSIIREQFKNIKLEDQVNIKYCMMAVIKMRVLSKNMHNYLSDVMNKIVAQTKQEQEQELNLIYQEAQREINEQVIKFQQQEPIILPKVRDMAKEEKISEKIDQLALVNININYFDKINLITKTIERIKSISDKTKLENKLKTRLNKSLNFAKNFLLQYSLEDLNEDNNIFIEKIIENAENFIVSEKHVENIKDNTNISVENNNMNTYFTKYAENQQGCSIYILKNYLKEYFENLENLIFEAKRFHSNTQPSSIKASANVSCQFGEIKFRANAISFRQFYIKIFFAKEDDKKAKILLLPLGEIREVSDLKVGDRLDPQEVKDCYKLAFNFTNKYLKDVKNLEQFLKEDAFKTYLKDTVNLEQPIKKKNVQTYLKDIDNKNLSKGRFN